MPSGSDVDRSMPFWLFTVGSVAWRAVAVGVALWLLVMGLRTLTVIVVPVLLAFLVAAVLDPLVRRAPEGWPSWLAPLAVVFLVAVVVLGGIAGLGVRIAREVPEMREEYRSGAVDVEDRFGIELPDLPGDDSSSESSSSGSGSSSDSSGSSTSSATDSTAAQVVRLAAELLFGMFLTFALAFLFLKDGRAMWAWLLDKMGAAAEEVDHSGRAAWSTLGSYVRGLTVVAAFDAIGIGAGLLVLGVPMVATLAALQFVASYVPTIGAWVAGGVAVFIAYADSGLSTAALTLVLVVIVQQIGNNVIEPWIMGRTMPLHPAMVLIVVTLGAIVWGIAGALLFVPMAAAISAMGHVLWQRRRPGLVGGDPG